MTQDENGAEAGARQSVDAVAALASLASLGTGGRDDRLGVGVVLQILLRCLRLLRAGARATCSRWSAASPRLRC